MKTLVAYFSASGTTRTLAQGLAAAIGADQFEIKPSIPYTPEDLDWMNSDSRSSREMGNRSSRPGVRDKLSNMDEYDTIFLGFPIWWYIAPTIINTFLEQYDFTGKTIIPFATSGSSGMGRTNEYLAVSCRGANLVEGRRFSRTATGKDAKKWASKYLH